MHKKHIILSLFFLFYYSSPSLSQDIKIVGKVMDTQANLIEDALIVAKGTKEKAVTDSAGNFTITCAQNDKLKVKAKGFVNATIKVGKKTDFLNIVLKSSGIDYASYQTIFDAMRALFTDVEVEGETIYVISQGQGGRRGGTALIVLDDVIIQQSELKVLPTNTIKSIKILKDLETVSYGDRGASGVVVIRTVK